MTVSMDEIRMKAGGAVMALANRAQSKGRIDRNKKRKPGWVDGSFGGVIDPKKFREAIAYCEIAASIDQGVNGAFAIHTKAYLLEDLSDFKEAEQCYLSLAGSDYAVHGLTGAQRCRDKQKRNSNPLQESSAVPQSAAEKVTEAGAETGTQDPEELASTAAQQFVDFLLDQDYDAAKGMLHSSLSDVSARDLKRSFEDLFADQPFPESANAFDALLEWPHKRKEDLAYIYVAIDSEDSEAVSVVVARDNGNLTIREIEWGRP